MGKKKRNDNSEPQSGSIEGLHDYEDLLENIESIEDLGTDDDLLGAIIAEDEPPKPD